MSESSEPETSNEPPARPEDRPGPAPADAPPPRTTLVTVTCCLVIAATSWYLLKEFAGLFRPLLLAIFLCYMILPAHLRLRRHIPGLASIIVLASICVGALWLLGLLIVTSAVELNEDMPNLVHRLQDILHRGEKFYHDHLPEALVGNLKDPTQSQNQLGTWVRSAAGSLAAAAADAVSDAILVAVYLVFLLIEVGNMPERIRAGFDPDRAGNILAVVGNINQAMASFLRVKVKASLVLAVPATVLLICFDIKFALMWGALTFLLNFVPYLGSVVACSGPIAFAYLESATLGRPTLVALLLISIHMLSAYVVEPGMTGKAVGLSPLFILLALAFWGLCWGLVGLLLAVPLTVMVKIVLENIPFTQPIARFMA